MKQFSIIVEVAAISNKTCFKIIFPCYLKDLWPCSKRRIKRVVPVERQLGSGCAGRNPQRRPLAERPVRLTSLDGLYSPHGPLLSCNVTQTVDRVSVAETTE